MYTLKAKQMIERKGNQLCFADHNSENQLTLKIQTKVEIKINVQKSKMVVCYHSEGHEPLRVRQSGSDIFGSDDNDECSFFTEWERAGILRFVLSI